MNALREMGKGGWARNERNVKPYSNDAERNALIRRSDNGPCQGGNRARNSSCDALLFSGS